MEESENPITWLGVLATLGGAVLGYLATYFGKKSDNSTNIKIAEIQADKREYDKLKEQLRAALESVRNLKVELKKSHDKTISIEKKFDAVKVAYKIIFKQYTKQFKDDPDSLMLLEELNHFINKE